MKTLFLISILLFSASASAALYMGGNYGYSSYKSDVVDKYHLNQKGNSYGGFFGIGKDYIGLEGYYQRLETKGKIKHDGESYDFNTNATAIGAALRFSLNAFYFRLGTGRYTLQQKATTADASSQQAVDEIYKIQNNVTKNGALIGAGAHKRFGNNFLTFIDYSRHQISGNGSYDVISVGIAFNLPDSLFGLGRL